MKRLFFSFILILALLQFSSCNTQGCEDLPSKYSNYHEAISKVRSTEFELEEILNTEKSSWINSASFYSCDSKTGFLIVRIRSSEYIHQNVPISVWENFKNADSFGNYYNSYLKGKFKLTTN